MKRSKIKTVEDYLKEAEEAKQERQRLANISYEYELRSCKSKIKFSHEAAKKKSQLYGNYYYKCNLCGSYHLTSQPTYESIMEE